MTTAGDTDPSLAAATVSRLRAHADRIVAAARVPARARADMVDELSGHLVERTIALMANGHAEADAADAATATFGGVEALATDLSTAFHSRLWSSTIGVLLPAIAVRATNRPGVIGWLRFALVIGMVLSALAIASAAWSASLGRAVVSIGLLALGLGGLFLAYRALALGQRWALWYAIAFAIDLVVYGVISVIFPDPPGSITIPLGGLLGLGLLLGVNFAWGRLQAFVAGSRPLGRGLRGLVVASFLGSAVGVPLVNALPDPTQAGTDYVRLLLSVVCDHGDVVEPGLPVEHDIQRMTVHADMEWHQGDVFANGLDGLLNPERFGDTAGFRALGDSLIIWGIAPQEPPVVDLATGDAAGWFGSTSPSVELIPNTIGSFTVGIDLDAIRAGRTLRTTWLVIHGTGERPWPRIEVSYAHLDRFVLTATAGCGESVVGESVPVPVAPTPQMVPVDDSLAP
jgi:hypothetical protein